MYACVCVCVLGGGGVRACVIACVRACSLYARDFFFEGLSQPMIEDNS